VGRYCCEKEQILGDQEEKNKYILVTYFVTIQFRGGSPIEDKSIETLLYLVQVTLWIELFLSRGCMFDCHAISFKFGSTSELSTGE